MLERSECAVSALKLYRAREEESESEITLGYQNKRDFAAGITSPKRTKFFSRKKFLERVIRMEM